MFNESVTCQFHVLIWTNNFFSCVVSVPQMYRYLHTIYYCLLGVGWILDEHFWLAAAMNCWGHGCIKCVFADLLLLFSRCRARAYSTGKAICERLKDSIPRQMFEIAVQASIGSKIIARETWVKGDLFTICQKFPLGK